MSEIEYNFIQNQIESNERIRNIIQFEITSLLNIVAQKRKWIDQLEQNDKELNLRILAIKDKDKNLIKYYNG